MLSSSSNNENASRARPDTITIAVGCTHATMGSCILNLQTKSSSSPQVKCINDATYKHNDDLFTYYRCQKHDIIMCCGCTDREQKKEEQERHQSNKFTHELYEPEEGEITHDDFSSDGYSNQRKYGTKQTEIKSVNKGNRKRKASAPLASANRPPNKKMKTNNQNWDFHFNALVQMRTDQQNEIQQLKESKQRSIEREKKLNKRIVALKNKSKEKDVKYGKIKHDKDVLERTVNDLTVTKNSLNGKIKTMTRVFEKNKNDIIARNKEQVGKLQRYEKTISKLKETERNLRDEFNELRQSNTVLKQSNKKQLDKILTENKRIKLKLMDREKQLKDIKKSNDEYERKRGSLKIARDTSTFPQFINQINAFLDWNN